MKYVLMRQDELGEVRRAFGDEYLVKEFYFPDYESDDEEMHAAFCAWTNTIEEKANAIWQKLFGEESTLFLEVLYSDMFRRMSISQLEAYAETYLD